jgi:hypothetical protein
MTTDSKPENPPAPKDPYAEVTSRLESQPCEPSGYVGGDTGALHRIKVHRPSGLVQCVLCGCTWHLGTAQEEMMRAARERG